MDDFGFRGKKFGRNNERRGPKERTRKAKRQTGGEENIRRGKEAA